MYNKFRPVNRMYYIKCGVNSHYSHNSGCYVRSVIPWVTVLSRHSIHKDGDILQIYFCVIFRETRHHAQAHVTSRTLCALFLAARRTRTAAHWGSLAIVCYGDFCWGLLLLLLLFFFFFLFFFFLFFLILFFLLVLFSLFFFFSFFSFSSSSSSSSFLLLLPPPPSSSSSD